MKEKLIATIKSKLSPMNILMGIKDALIGLVKAVINGGPLALLGFIASYFTTWWAIAIVGFFYAAFQKNLSAKQAFASGTAAGTALWTVYATWLSMSNNHSLAIKIGSMLTGGIGGLSPVELITITGLMGGLVTALGCLAGVYAREFLYDSRLKFGWK